MRVGLGWRLFWGAALLAVGCRLPRPYLADWKSSSSSSRAAGDHERSTGAETSGDAEGRGGPIQTASNQRSDAAPSLARPVALIDWQPGQSSTWHILYGTNRGTVDRTRPGPRLYGNTVMNAPEYGVTTVRLPDRERGRDRADSDSNRSPWGKILPAAARKPANESARDADLTGRIESVRQLGPTMFGNQLRDLTARSPEQDVLLFVHGFNVSYAEAILRATQVAADLPFNGAIVAYSWPSQGGVDNYNRDGKVIDQSELPFTEFLTTLVQSLPSEARINIVVHSMGNRLVQRALWRLPDEFTDPPRFAEIVFCAPDVGVDEFRRNIRQAQKVARRVTLYQCCNDSALIASMFRNKEERAGSPNAPVLIEGMETIETGPIDASLLGHSYYGSNPSVLRDLFAIVKEHAPASERPWLKSHTMPFQKTPLWIFSKVPAPLEWDWGTAEAGTAEVVISADEP